MAEAHLYGESMLARSAPGEELYDYLTEPAWHGDALCKEFPELSWFPERGEDLAPAKEVCRRCLTQTECLATAMADEELQGIWGGTSHRERRRLRRGAVA